MLASGMDSCPQDSPCCYAGECLSARPTHAPSSSAPSAAPLSSLPTAPPTAPPITYVDDAENEDEEGIGCAWARCLAYTDSNSCWQYGGAVNLAVLSGPLLRRLRCLYRHPGLASAHGCPERVSHSRAGGLERVPRRVVDRRRRKLWPYPAQLLRCVLRGRCLRTNVVRGGGPRLRRASELRGGRLGVLHPNDPHPDCSANHAGPDHGPDHGADRCADLSARPRLSSQPQPNTSPLFSMMLASFFDVCCGQTSRR